MKLALTMLLWLALGICYGQTPFRHLKHNNKLRTSQSHSAAKKEAKLTLRSPNSQKRPDLHPSRLQNQKVAQRRLHKRQRTAPEHLRYSNQDLYLEIRRGEGMEKQKAQNRKMWSGK
ncbi:MAG: hypothetical protein AAFN10_06570 [Bacteroidota bacterium]